MTDLSIEPLRLINREPWTARAICRGQHQRFDTDRGDNTKYYTAAIAACRLHCPVIADCRQQVLREQPDGGVWAGELIPVKSSHRARSIVFARMAEEGDA